MDIYIYMYLRVIDSSITGRHEKSDGMRGGSREHCWLRREIKIGRDEDKNKNGRGDGNESVVSRGAGREHAVSRDACTDVLINVSIAAEHGFIEPLSPLESLRKKPTQRSFDNN